MKTHTTTTPPETSANTQRSDGWMRRFVSGLFPRREIREEMMGGEKYWMIYRVWLGSSSFFERWNTPQTAAIRLGELNSRERLAHAPSPLTTKTPRKPKTKLQGGYPLG